MKETQNKVMKSNIFKIGYIENRETYIKQLEELLDADSKIDITSLDDSASEDKLEYYNRPGYRQFQDGTKVDKETAAYIRFATPYKNKSGEKIYGWFYKFQKGFKGCNWGSDKDFKKIVQSNNIFSIGSMYFSEREDGINFLEDIASKTIPESWTYKNKENATGQPILKSYLENVLERLKKEASGGAKNKLVYSSDGQHVMFNTNLLDKFFHPIIIAGKVERHNSDISILNPKWGLSKKERKELKFGNEEPVPPQFFNDVNEVIFQTDWEIDTEDFETFTHIIEERRNRFPAQYQNEETDILARKLEDAIKFAVELAQRNYKFIVPMYRPQKNAIQLLMPIYLNGAYSKHPDFALILTPDKEMQMYIPETILQLDQVYNNARLIAKPDEAWLNPDTIK